MATVRKSLTITEAQEQWIKLQIENGGFANDSEYMRHLIRLDEERNREFSITKAAIRAGYDSGVSPKVRTVDEIMKAAIDRRKDKTQGIQNA
ncbi:type II toxin-antitoxin system ParD family antitoxin [Arenibacter sp. S6351L]|uniref:ribbon-helix-helix domain-containing protein n=1 Tax=Arenibacter sp. S6351L TaxID=2926407 RepID=UPI001FF587F8|nr:type II toxin-antitoxin system ParD family antitoxin [Arenibacter sp. S6351L]MCK0136389.1 type II toxin-antitoxin system ParD family antitoxin [Arenibacter sp. S6351L]